MKTIFSVVNVSQFFGNRKIWKRALMSIRTSFLGLNVLHFINSCCHGEKRPINKGKKFYFNNKIRKDHVISLS